MKKIRIISVVDAVVLLLLLNFSLISSNGKVEEMYVSVNTVVAGADGQCKLVEILSDCYCEIGTVYCLLAHCGSGAVCSPDVEVNQ
jgi:hypothetical protein